MKTLLSLARRAIRFEWNMWKSLYLWIARRRPKEDSFSYASAVTPLIIGIIVVSFIEIPVVHMLLPWPTAKFISLLTSAYGLFWMIGLLASLRVHPHLLSDSGLRIRYGATIDMTIPWEAIASIRNRMRSTEKSRTIQMGTEPGVLNIVMASQTNLDVILREAITVPLANGKISEPITELRFYADDPAGLAKSANGLI